MPTKAKRRPAELFEPARSSDVPLVLDVQALWREIAVYLAFVTIARNAQEGD